jgi:hypothetical protein
MDNQKYIIINKIYLAYALNFLGFHFMKFQENEKTVFGFERTENFEEALANLLELRKQLKNE